MKLPTVLLLLLGLLAPLSAEEAATPDQEARLLAGLDLAGTPLETLSKQGASMQHAREFATAWSQLEQHQLLKIRAWAPSILGNDAQSHDPLFYFFSGPDFLYANTFFPNASSYVFCGLEPVGNLPDVLSLSPAVLSSALSNLRKSLNAVLSFSFFITKEMKGDLRATQLSGTLPVLYVFLARLGNTIEKVEKGGLDVGGEFTPGQNGEGGVKITFSKNGQPAQALYYFSTDLSNSGIKTKPAFIHFCEKLGPGNSFAKAASYLMHMDEFSLARDFLLTHSKTMVEDDSGIPLKYFTSDGWDVLCLGRYPGPIKMFEGRYQHDLSAAIHANGTPPLTFSFGYRWHPSESSIIIATSLKYVPKAIPAPAQ